MSQWGRMPVHMYIHRGDGWLVHIGFRGDEAEAF